MIAPYTLPHAPRARTDQHNRQGPREATAGGSLDAYSALVAKGAQLVVFPELVTCGYPPRDLLFKRHFVPDVQVSLKEIAAAIGEVPALVGTVEANTAGTGRPFYNTAAFCHRGVVVSFAHKCLLPTYDVFDEVRYFGPAAHPRS